MQKYSKKVLEHFTKPHNQGKIKDADGVGTVGNPKCGDIMRLYIKVTKDKQGQEIIKDVKFETLGCGAAISTSSMTTDLAKGKTLDQALEITNKSVAEELGGLPSAKMHCSNLAADALHAAIKNYKTKK
ncbi:MAG: Nitrogen-fixing NifU domain protein [Candidatus Moranbacteria bacterium GW2011_GWE1_36_7]|nr:MAG: Nitrogen-fixing NifU domain protein [Candidatus Moranbacteria bacterium GW2011_GWD2_36_12]KKQ06555.1 MAG: Nitrogen-fixing NifU domain protein [Candidatus Moranbacteria bacterium GW2011_GWE2_36_40]KKQ15322.1 MAG: Nitrogen-fixing NifU domain protein [Candidatus Moranbacteria bacterium GW2011_GWE1_36_7]